MKQMSESSNYQIKRPARKQALGRGLGSLLGEPASEPLTERINMNPIDSFRMAHRSDPSKIDAEFDTQASEGLQMLPLMQAKVPDTARVWQVAIENVFPNKNQPRQLFSSDALKELSDSIREKGILQPIVARKMKDGGYEIVAGERRWRAAQLAGLHDVPVILKEIDDQEALELALIENIQRSDLNPMEEAEAYAHLIKKYNLTQQKLSEKVGKERVTIANTMRLLNLAPEVRIMVSKGELSLGQAKVLLSVEDFASQRRLADRVKNDRLSVRATEKLVLKAFKELDQAERATESGENVAKKTARGLADDMQKLLGTKVDIDYSLGRGKISISFYSDDDLNNLAEKIKSAWQK
jgi:ParB family chromosome partitioning protein